MNTRMIVRNLIKFGLLIAVLETLGFDRNVHAAPAEKASSGLVQFTANWHVLGFGAGEVYVAGLTHALHITFIDGKPVRPSVGGDSQISDHVLPLGTIKYSGVWPGVDVVCTAEPGAIFESTYIVYPGGHVEDIRLGHNVPVERESDGSLRLAFESGY